MRFSSGAPRQFLAFPSVEFGTKYTMRAVRSPVSATVNSVSESVPVCAHKRSAPTSGTAAATMAFAAFPSTGAFAGVPGESATGGVVATGGAITGGFTSGGIVATGGAVMGGVVATGGAVTGGAPTGDSSFGGASP